MLNNDILRRIRYVKDYTDQEMIKIFALSGYSVTREKVICWLKKDDHPDYISSKTTSLLHF